MTPPTTLSTCAPVLPTCARRSHHCSFRHPVPMLLRLFRRLPLRLLSLRLLSLLLLPAIPVDASPRCPAGAPTFACTMYPDSADIRACSTSVIEHCIWRQRTMHVHSPLIPATVLADALCTAHHACIMHYMQYVICHISCIYMTCSARCFFPALVFALFAPAWRPLSASSGPLAEQPAGPSSQFQY